MSSSFFTRLSRRHAAVVIPALTGGVILGLYGARCDQNKEGRTPSINIQPLDARAIKDHTAEEFYHGFFPRRQLLTPKLEFPLWDLNWDGRHPTPLPDKEVERKRQRLLRKQGVTRHIVLIRHGQYDERHKEDDKRILTELGRQQAHLTGKRLAEMIAGGDDKATPCNVTFLHVSDLARAKETADIIAQYLPTVKRSVPDARLNEGRPAHTIPSGGKVSADSIIKMDEQHKRIEKAFRAYFYRADEPRGDHEDLTKHEYEIIVGHANVIRYFVLRALQLPPEAWLRTCNFNCSLTYLTIRPTGSVSLRMFGDIGHLPYRMCTFSQHHGYNW
jgi:serine/threonine-protein phosphatase PGAM5